ncbi:MAG: choice-of-anchor J domain-containing protein, partial [Candidatus Delongbacteria bacterium]|nr:choice-of-anchor J domain-containing protein [Candidatus Delongbacteria bacterium]
EGWTLNTVGAGWIKFANDPTFDNVKTGDYCISHQDVSGTQDDWIITPAIEIPDSNSCTVSFWQANSWAGYLEFHEVAVSIDGGGTWTQIFVEDTTPATDDVPLNQVVLSLAAFAGETVNIGWHYTGNYCDAWYVDDIKVYYDEAGPSIVDVVGNEALSPVIGAYLNNDLTLSVTANDISAVGSITGHYSIDGAPVVDLVFGAAKGGDEVWTATIPAESAVVTGTINFDCIDIGGNVAPTTADYDFVFVTDVDAPVFTYVTGVEEFINIPLNLTIAFTDESAITSCGGSYSKDGFVTQYDFDLSPSKVHDYSYTGMVPAETVEVLDGEVIFRIGDAAGNSIVTDSYQVRWRDGQIEFEEDFESDTDGWTLGGRWAIVEEGEFTSSSWALTESPGGNY